ncbi:TrkH family potassium uptake protein [Rhodobacteraceae bacterium]|nr:TrkH family potassium uptake protein [Paracoccaceae bacterium]
MFDFRPVGYLIGLLVALLGMTMVIPMLADLYAGNDHAGAFLEAMIITVLIGGMIALACANAVSGGMRTQQLFVLTTGVWVVLPIFGALPFMFGATGANITDSYFESMSGLTTTGSTVFSGLDDLPVGLLLWRSMLQWFGGIGIIVVAMAFLPELRVGGMQIFRSESFDTDGKVLPRAGEIATRISVVYLVLTVSCGLAYLASGMTLFDAINLAMTTIATGGFSTHDMSFEIYQGQIELVAMVFMILASLPFVRYVQLLAGATQPILSDSQVRTFVGTLFVLILIVAGFRVVLVDHDFYVAFREAAFNLTSIMTGTGFSSTDYQGWGGFPVAIFFFAGLIGGCAGSTCCSVKIFRYQLLFSSIANQIRRIHSPHGVYQLKYAGRSVSEDVISSVMVFLTLFMVTLGVVAVLLSATGLDFITSVSGAATAIANVGPGLGDTIGPVGNFATLNDTAKWILLSAMLVGRLELLVVFVLFTSRFWRA